MIGENLARLDHLLTKFDPSDLFNFWQIRPDIEAEKCPRSRAVA